MTAANDKTCALCGGKKNTLVVELENGKYSIWRCETCTNAFTFPPCGDWDYAAEYFGKDQMPGSDRKIRRKISDLPKQWQKAVRTQIELCVKFAANRGKVLDLGCGDGFMIDLLAEQGLKGEGIDPSAEGTALAIAAGLPVVRGYFPHPEIKGPYEVVMMTHVLEHIPDPKTLLRQLASVAPNGHLIVTQADYRGVIARSSPAKWYGWSPHVHFWHFTARGLRRVLEEVGFRVELVRRVSMTHLSRRHKYFLPILDRIPGLADQFVMVARIPEK